MVRQTTTTRPQDAAPGSPDLIAERATTLLAIADDISLNHSISVTVPASD